METPDRASLIRKRGYREDIKGDALSLYLSNYPVAAQYLAERIGSEKKVLVDLCCGVGVTLEYLARHFKRIIAIDIDEKVLHACRGNLQAAGVLDKTILIQGDVRDEAIFQNLKGDIVIYDIPYWYPHKYLNYTTKTEMDVENPDLGTVINRIRKYISNDIIIFTPPTMNYEFLKDIVGECECRKVFINGKHDRNYVFLGELVRQKGATVAELSTAATPQNNLVPAK